MTPEQRLPAVLGEHLLTELTELRRVGVLPPDPETPDIMAKRIRDCCDLTVAQCLNASCPVHNPNQLSLFPVPEQLALL